MADPDPDKDPKKAVKPVKPVSGGPALAMGFSKRASQPIRFPKMRPTKTFIDPELRMTLTYLTAGFFMS
jgi:hypothetical protein